MVPSDSTAASPPPPALTVDGPARKTCEPPASYRSLSGPSGPELPKKSEKKSPGASGPGAPKSLEKVRKVWSSGTFSRLFGTPGPEARETFFRLFGISCPEGPRGSCSSREGSQPKTFQYARSLTLMIQSMITSPQHALPIVSYAFICLIGMLC